MKTLSRMLTLAVFAAVGLGTQAQKLSPQAKIIALQNERAQSVSSHPSLATADTTAIPVFLHLTSEDALVQIETLGGKVHARFGNGRVTATLPAGALQQIADIDGVSYVQPAGNVHLLMDEARGEAGADLAHSGAIGLGAYTGKGVVVGIIDQGLEFRHVAFYDRNRTALRIRRVWLQNGTGNAPAGFGYGKELVTEAEIIGAVTDVTSSYHATHVANIAAGADSSSPYYGVAPDADIVFVSCKSTAANVADAAKYIFDYADSVGKPCVVNISLGMHQGPHDGSSETDCIFDAITGPGKIIVGAAGNEGEQDIHVSKRFTENDTQLKTMQMLIAGDYYQYGLADIWGSTGSDLKVKVAVVNALKGNILYETEEVSCADNEVLRVPLTQSSGAIGTVTVAATIDPHNRRPNAVVQDTITALPANHRIGIIVSGEAGAEAHIWDPYKKGFTGASRPGWTGADAEYTVSELGGTGKSVISVGAYCTRLQYTSLDNLTYTLNEATAGSPGGRCPFSSHGPTSDGRMKPDVCAPGAGIVSGVSKLYRSFSSASSTLAGKTSVDGRDYYYGINMGTSMSSPYVCGAVALWLQANPALTPADVRQIIASTARRDDHTDGVADNLWGYGKIDVAAGLKETLASVGIEETGNGEPFFSVTFDRSDCSATVRLPSTGSSAAVTLYDSAGTPVATFRKVTDGQRLRFGFLSRGVYVLRLSTGGNVETIKTVF